jgi:hypothetical protein
MLCRRSLLLLLVSCAISAHLAAQQTTTSQTVQKDPQAVSVLTQALNAAGGPAALSPIQDFKGTGTITYYWGGEEVNASVTVKGRGTGQFRLDANLPDGVRSWAVNNGTGFLKNTDGTVKVAGYDNSVNFGSLTFPYAYMVTLLQDSSMSISYVGLETAKNGNKVQHIQIHKVFTPDPGGMFGKLTTRDFFIDPATFQVVSTLDMVHPKNASNVNIPHEMQFSNYQRVNGVFVPFTVTEFTAGQRTFTLQLSEISFNDGLQDVDFQE